MGISREQALDCFASDDLIGIGMEADAVRRRLHPEGVVSYVVNGTVDLMRLETVEEMHDRIAAIVDAGGTGVQLQGVRERGPEWLEGILSGIKHRFGSLWIEGPGAGEIAVLAGRFGLTVRELIERLRDAGMGSIPGAGADSFAMDEWVSVHRTAHQLGMKTSATIVFGAGETVEQRVSALDAIRQLQEETGGFTALTPVSFQPAGGREDGLEEATAVEYLKTLAIARMYLDTIENVQASLETQGLKVVQMGLRFGGNDVGSARAGVDGATEEELRRLIRDAGFKPVQRDPLYRTMFLN